MDHTVRTVLRFERFVLDLARGRLRAGDLEIDLRPKTFEVLRYLMARPRRRFASLVSRSQGAHPALRISRRDAAEYVAWLTRRMGRPYQLPTETEWECSALAVTRP